MATNGIGMCKALPYITLSFQISFGSVYSLYHIVLLVILKWDIAVDVLSSFPLGLELLQGQFAWKEELASSLLPCSFFIWGLSPCLVHPSPALRKPTVRTWVRLGKPSVRNARRPWFLLATYMAGQAETSSILPMKIIFKSWIVKLYRRQSWLFKIKLN